MGPATDKIFNNFSHQQSKACMGVWVNIYAICSYSVAIVYTYSIIPVGMDLGRFFLVLTIFCNFYGVSVLPLGSML